MVLKFSQSGFWYLFLKSIDYVENVKNMVYNEDIRNGLLSLLAVYFPEEEAKQYNFWYRYEIELIIFI